MCSHYQSPSRERLSEAFGITTDTPYQPDLWPGYRGAFLRVGADQPLEAQVGVFGLLPAWVKDQKLSRRAYNARSETVADKPMFRSAWKQARHCVIPAEAIYEPDWRSGKAVPTRIQRADGGLLLIAGLWEHWRTPEGEVIHSYTMLTVNADDHALMNQYHRVEDEKRMVVILPSGSVQDWLHASAQDSPAFMRQYPAERLCASH